MRIFIIDDNADGADSLAMLLELEGHTTRAVHSPQRALAEIEAFQPDFVLLDIAMPEMDGYELLQRLRALRSLAGARFIALTGYGQEMAREQPRGEGFDSHLLKPVKFEALSDLLASRGAAN